METIELNLVDGSSRKFQHRGSSADNGVIQQVFVNQDYSLKRLARGLELQNFYHALVAGGQQPLIIDAGANIGASVCWFALEYPQSRIIAIEPDAQNFELLDKNTTGLNAELHLAAIGSRGGRVSMVDPGIGEWGYRTIDDPAGACERIAMSAVVESNVKNNFAPFIAKIDIEGGEADLFLEPNDWVGNFPLLIVELHDWLMPGKQTSRSFIKCMAEYDRDFVQLGENIFSIRN